MFKLYYCNTIYFCNCGKELNSKSDINPLIIRANKNKKFLVLCAREGQIARISQKLLETEYKDIKIVHLGWWDFKNKELIDVNNNLLYEKLLYYDIIIILDKNRIDSRFIPLCNAIESFCQNPPKNPSPLCA